MNCQTFEELVSELASEKLMDAALRKSAFVHASACHHCSARLADQRTLSAQLSVLAEATGDELAPPLLKKELMAAFAQRHSAQSALFRNGLPGKISLESEEWRKSWLRWTLAAAALIACLMISAIIWRQWAMSGQEEKANMTKPAPTPAQESPTPIPESSVASEKHDQNRTGKSPEYGSRRRAIKPGVLTGTSANESEIASEFVPLTFAGETQALQNGYIVRVEVPRATLIAMGLPLSVEREEEAIKADVMMGDNGVAYAIRVVRSSTVEVK
jgi:hypothetical protein